MSRKPFFPEFSTKEKQLALTNDNMMHVICEINKKSETKNLDFYNYSESMKEKLIDNEVKRVLDSVEKLESLILRKKMHDQDYATSDNVAGDHAEKAEVELSLLKEAKQSLIWCMYSLASKIEAKQRYLSPNDWHEEQVYTPYTSSNSAEI